MPKLREKSKMNFDAANKLIDLHLYAPSVHCSYYSCFQLMKFTIIDFIGMSYSELDTEIYNSKKSTHKLIINKITDCVKENYSIPDYIFLTRKIKDLKNFRIDSDYNNIEINFENSRKAYEVAREVRTKIKEIFNV